MFEVHLKEVIHDINVTVANTPQIPEITLEFGRYGLDGHRTTEGSMFAFFRAFKVTVRGKVDYASLVERLCDVYPNGRYEKVYPVMRARILNGRLNGDLFRYAYVVSYNDTPVYPILFPEFLRKISQDTILVREITFEIKIIL